MDSTVRSVRRVILNIEKRARPNENVRRCHALPRRIRVVEYADRDRVSCGRQFSDADFRRFVHASASECVQGQAQSRRLAFDLADERDHQSDSR
jgi:hypothetical protein